MREEDTLRWKIAHGWWHVRVYWPAVVRHWWHWKLPRWVCYRVPRKVVYFAFIRVYAILGQGPGPDVIDAMNRWEAGEGR